MALKQNRDYGLYIKSCPGVDNPRDYKVGVFALAKARARLATYQNAVGPVYTECFDHVWLGDENHVKYAEKLLKREYDAKILSAEAGLSEWISDITRDELLTFIQEIRGDDYGVRLMDVPNEFLPLTMSLCEDLKDWYEANK
jgi:hypothetical protein